MGAPLSQYERDRMDAIEDGYVDLAKEAVQIAYLMLDRAATDLFHAGRHYERQQVARQAAEVEALLEDLR